jgi:molybdopterin converting factor small subunit
LKEALYDEKGNFKKGVRIFLNGRDSRFIPEDDFRLQSGDRVLFLPLLAGG